jgi:hypothetical protein
MKSHFKKINMLKNTSRPAEVDMKVEEPDNAT